MIDDCIDDLGERGKRFACLIGNEEFNSYLINNLTSQFMARSVHGVETLHDCGMKFEERTLIPSKLNWEIVDMIRCISKRSTGYEVIEETLLRFFELNHNFNARTLIDTFFNNDDHVNNGMHMVFIDLAIRGGLSPESLGHSIVLAVNNDMYDTVSKLYNAGVRLNEKSFYDLASLYYSNMKNKRVKIVKIHRKSSTRIDISDEHKRAVLNVITSTLEDSASSCWSGADTARICRLMAKISRLSKSAKNRCVAIVARAEMIQEAQ